MGNIHRSSPTASWKTKGREETLQPLVQYIVVGILAAKSWWRQLCKSIPSIHYILKCNIISINYRLGSTWGIVRGGIESYLACENARLSWRSSNSGNSNEILLLRVVGQWRSELNIVWNKWSMSNGFRLGMCSMITHREYTRSVLLTKLQQAQWHPE